MDKINNILVISRILADAPPIFEEFDMNEFREDFADGWEGYNNYADSSDAILRDPDILMELLIQEYSNFWENHDQLEGKIADNDVYSTLLGYYERPTFEAFRALFTQLYGEVFVETFVPQMEAIRDELIDL